MCNRNEQKRKPELVGALVLSPQEIYARIKTYKERLADRNGGCLYAAVACTNEPPLIQSELVRPKLYFVKVDAQACYDTIKQDKLLEIVEDILEEVRHILKRETMTYKPCCRTSIGFNDTSRSRPCLQNQPDNSSAKHVRTVSDDSIPFGSRRRNWISLNAKSDSYHCQLFCAHSSTLPRASRTICTMQCLLIK